ncbi:hypothetical protein, partial [Acinetobacter baumannii]|uniref:hypothetical protein n=1 Tax=Acinetobacter baumannii TaxID=470 RepID=UPI001A7EE99B
SNTELDALYEAHASVTEALSRILNTAREKAGLSQIKPLFIEQRDTLSLYEWASDASLKKRPQSQGFSTTSFKN